MTDALIIVDVQNDFAVVKVRNDGNTPLAIEGRFEFLKPGAAAPTSSKG